MEDIQNELHALAESQNFTHAEVKRATEIAEEARSEVMALKTECVSLKRENTILHDKLLQIESQSRRINLLFYGFPEERNETPAILRQKISSVLEKINIDPNTRKERLPHFGPPPSYRKTQSSSQGRPIIFKWFSYVDREFIWNNKYRLAGTDYFVREDFPDEIQNNRRQLYPIMRTAIRQGQKAVLSVDKLIINSQVYRVSNLHQLPENLQPHNAAMKRDGNYTFYWGSNSPFSNFYTGDDTKFTIDGTTYSCGEQYFQHTKAKVFGDNETASHILKETNPANMKRLGKQVKGYKQSKWLEVAPELIQRGTEEKFRQNPRLLQFLLETKDTTLVEATSKDLIWGCGVDFHSKNLSDQSTWKGQNLMGKILVEARKNLK